MIQGVWKKNLVAGYLDTLTRTPELSKHHANVKVIWKDSRCDEVPDVAPVCMASHSGFPFPLHPSNKKGKPHETDTLISNLDSILKLHTQ